MACEVRPRPRSGSQRKAFKMVAMEARHGPARPAVRRWLASFLVEWIVR